MATEPNESELQQRMLSLALELVNNVEQRADVYANWAADLRAKAEVMRREIERCRQEFSVESWATVRELIAATCGDLDEDLEE
jgi:hypothetical protein